jgi:hypothetical protein
MKHGGLNKTSRKAKKANYLTTPWIIFVIVQQSWNAKKLDMCRTPQTIKTKTK